MRQLLSEAVDTYVAYRTLHYAPNTTRADQQCLRRFLATVGNIYTHSIEARHVDLFLSQRATTCAPQTMNGYMRALRAFFKWCRTNRLMTPNSDPMAGRRWMKAPPRKRLFISAPEFPHLLDSAPDPRERVAVALGLYLFLRSGEMTSLQIGDVDLDSGFIDVTIHKTKERDRMPICSELDSELRSWLTHYGSLMSLQPHYFLVPSRTSPQVSRLPGGEFVVRQDTRRYLPQQTITRPADVISRVLAAAGHPTHMEGGHTLRRSGARALYDALAVTGHDDAARRVQAMLHHTTITTTERYLDINIDKARRNKSLRGQPMFPSGTNVVALKVAQG